MIESKKEQKNVLIDEDKPPKTI